MISQRIKGPEQVVTVIGSPLFSTNYSPYMDSGAAIALSILSELGVDRIFIVSGTDYAQFVEERARGVGPEFVEVPHEITAVAAAIGYSFGGKLGVVALHTTPGTANGLGNIMNAYGSRIPLVVIAGRTPYLEEDGPAARNLRIHWTQEARDQGQIVRQWVKWDFEVRRASQVSTSVTRAVQLALSEPRGPVYLNFPREVTVEEAENRRIVMSPYEPGPDPAAIKKAQQMISEATNPVIITWRAGRREEWFNSLRNFAERAAIPVLNYVGEVVNYPSSGPMALDKFDISSADLLLVLENEVPWIPKKVKVRGRVIKVDVQPGHMEIPYYGFPCDLTVQSSLSSFLDSLSVQGDEERRARISQMKREQWKAKEDEINDLSRRKTIHPRYLSYHVGRLGLTVLNEYPLNPAYGVFDSFGSYLGRLSVGHLGYSLGAALGYTLATGRESVAVVGDGSFIFGVPEAFYYVAKQRPVLVVIFDNGGWLASAEAVEEVVPEGVAVAKRNFPGAELRRYDIGATVKAYGGHFRLIEDPSEVPELLNEGLNEVRKGRISVLQFVVEKTR
jgi:Thiamine pyrophosphate-requiring enzymes [acetolactate synthase, pyruvate dehydrogenase (cytochrome), glyoxylate carboligase, phosphonopyruvate decarboxylase]